MSRAPALYLVADRGFLGSDHDWLERLGDAAEALARLRADGVVARPGTVMLQLRVKDASAATRRPLVAEGLARARPAGVPVLLNGTEEEARELGFDGVHWPERLVPPSGTPDAAPESGADPAFLRGASVHSVEAARRAADAEADFLVFGPVFAPGSKAGSGVGIPALAKFVRASTLPVLAIGGVTRERAPACRTAGARGVAVVSAVFTPGVAIAEAVAGLLRAV